MKELICSYFMSIHTKTTLKTFSQTELFESISSTIKSHFNKDKMPHITFSTLFMQLLTFSALIFTWAEYAISWSTLHSVSINLIFQAWSIRLRICMTLIWQITGQVFKVHFNLGNMTLIMDLVLMQLLKMFSLQLQATKTLLT